MELDFDMSYDLPMEDLLGRPHPHPIPLRPLGQVVHPTNPDPPNPNPFLTLTSLPQPYVDDDITETTAIATDRCDNAVLPETKHYAHNPHRKKLPPECSLE